MSIDKKSLSELDICTQFITPAIQNVDRWRNLQFAEKEHTAKNFRELLSLCNALKVRLQSAQQEERGRLVESVLARFGGQYGK